MKTQEKINEFNFQDIKLEMFWSGKTDSHGKCQLEYRLFKGATLLTEGNDFHLGLGQYPDSVDCVVSLLGFLTMQEGDTDSEYFKQYLPEMTAFSKSIECQDIKISLYDYENSEDEVVMQEAQSWFSEHTKINI